MKNIMTMHIILCGLLGNIIIASEGSTSSTGAIVNTNNTKTLAQHVSAHTIKANMSDSSDSSHNSSPMAIDLSTTTKPKRSFSSGVSPKTRDMLSPRNSSESFTPPTLNYSSISEYMLSAKCENSTSSNQDNTKK